MMNAIERVSLIELALQGEMYRGSWPFRWPLRRLRKTVANLKAEPLTPHPLDCPIC